MDTFVLIVAMGIIAVIALVVLVVRNTKKEVKHVEQERAVVTPHTFETGRAHVGREITINPQDQHHKGEHRKIKVEAASLEDLSKENPNGANGIESIVAVVMTPNVRYADSGESVTQFEPPLDVKVRYTDADAAGAASANGLPQLSLGVAYPTDGGWKWERLKTHVTKEGTSGTLHTKLHSLHPNETIIICKP